MKQKNKKNLRDEKSHIASRVVTEVVQCKKNKVEAKSKEQKCQAPVFNDKNCQAEETVNMCVTHMKFRGISGISGSFT